MAGRKWVTAGKGLGKSEDGVAHSIKVPLKTDTSGVGFDPSKDFTDHWWTERFNETAKSITVEHSEDEVHVCSSGPQARLGKRKKSYQNSSKKHAPLYRQFVKASGEDANATVQSSTYQPVTVPKLSDTELLKACEGRTAHKGARHGLKQSGKLKRLEEQEKQMTETISHVT